MRTFDAIWIASYPKSGNTWIHSVLRQAGKGHGFPQIDMDVYNIGRNKGEGLIACQAVAPEVTTKPCVVLKTHASYNQRPFHNLNDVKIVDAAYIHVYRNPLDMLLSYLNFTKLGYGAHAQDATYKNNLFTDLLGFNRIYEYEDWRQSSLETIPQENLDHALDHFSDNGMVLKQFEAMSGSWLENTRSWLDAESALPGYSIRYEDCLANPAQIAKLSSLFTFNADEVLSALHGFNNKARSMSTGGSSEEKVFFNKMSAYYFIRYFSTSAIKRFLARYEEELTLRGYKNLFDLV